MNTARILFVALLAGICSIDTARADFTLSPGHYYTSNYFDRDIIEYDIIGNVVGSLTLSPALADEVRGLAFGPGNLLYATVVRGSGFAVLALDSSGAVQQTYPGSVFISGDIAYGKIALNNQYLYMAGGNQLTRFELGNPASGMSIYTNNQIEDVKILPNGNLLVGSAYEVNEITSMGAFVRNIPLVGESYTDIRGIEYDPVTNNLFVTHLGHTGFSFQLMRVDFSTGMLEESVTFTYANDLFLTLSGELLVGSRTETPRFYTEELDQVGMLGDGQQMFVTQAGAIPVPEPTAVAYLAVAVTGLLLRSLRRR